MLGDDNGRLPSTTVGGQLIMLSRVAAHLYWMSRYLSAPRTWRASLDVTQSSPCSTARPIPVAP